MVVWSVSGPFWGTLVRRREPRMDLPLLGCLRQMWASSLEEKGVTSKWDQQTAKQDARVVWQAANSIGKLS